MKKIITMLLVAVLLATALVGGSLAWFTDTVTVDSVVISGNIEVIQTEQERAPGGGLTAYTQDKNLAPLVQNGPYGTEPLEGSPVGLPDSNTRNYVDKIVTVSNVGANPAYVRTLIAVPTAGHISASPTGSNWLRWDAVRGSDSWSWSTAAEEWHMVDDAVIGGKTYDIYVATYHEMLAPGDTTCPSLLGFWMDSAVTCSGSSYYYTTDTGRRIRLEDLSSIEILVATQAVQTTTFTDPRTALDTVFGNVTADNNPWVNAGTTHVRTDAELAAALAAAGSGSTIRLADGVYTLPADLPAGVRIVGQGSEIILSTPDPVTASGVEFFNLTFAGGLTFRGSGEFDRVTFRGAFDARFNNPAYLTDCVFEAVCTWTVTEDAVRDTVIFRNCTGFRP